MKNKGFSIIELLVAIGILGVLVAFAIPQYQKYKSAAIIAAMKLEATELNRYLKYAYSVDGGYHQKIYTMGYRPSENMIASAGFTTGVAVDVNTKCNRFPAKDNNKNVFTPYLTLTDNDMFDEDEVVSATKGSLICSLSDECSATDEATDTGVNSGFVKVSDDDNDCLGFNNKNYEPSCDEFYLYSRAEVQGNAEQILLNHKGLTCYADKDKEVEKQF